MHRIAYNYKEFITRVLSHEPKDAMFDLDDRLTVLVEMLRSHFLIDTTTTFKSLRDIEKQIENECSAPFYEQFTQELFQSSLSRQLGLVLNKEADFVNSFQLEADLRAKSQLDRPHEFRLEIRPRHIMFWCVHVLEGYVRPRSFEPDILSLPGRKAQNFSHFRLEPKTKSLVFSSLPEDSSSIEEAVDNEIAQVFKFPGDIDDMSEDLVDIVSHQFERLGLEQRAFAKSMDRYDEDMRSLATWARGFCVLKERGHERGQE